MNHRGARFDFVVPAAWQQTRKIAGRYVTIYRPRKALQWIVYRVLTKRLWKFYKRSFEYAVRWCYRHRAARYLFAGELLVFPAYGVWALWPIALPLLLVCAALARFASTSFHSQVSERNLKSFTHALSPCGQGRLAHRGAV